MVLHFLVLTIEIMQEYAALSDGKEYWLYDDGSGIRYEVYSKHCFLGVIDTWVKLQQFSKAPSFKVWCKCSGHSSKCNKLVGMKHRSISDMLDLCASWLAKGPGVDEAHHFSSRPT